MNTYLDNLPIHRDTEHPSLDRLNVSVDHPSSDRSYMTETSCYLDPGTRLLHKCYTVYFCRCTLGHEHSTCSRRLLLLPRFDKGQSNRSCMPRRDWRTRWTLHKICMRLLARHSNAGTDRHHNFDKSPSLRRRKFQHYNAGSLLKYRDSLRRARHLVGSVPLDTPHTPQSADHCPTGTYQLNRCCRSQSQRQRRCRQHKIYMCTQSLLPTLGTFLCGWTGNVKMK